MSDINKYGLELETDPKIKKQFAVRPYRRIVDTLDESDYIRREEEFQAREDFLSRTEAENEKIAEKAVCHKCKWGDKRIARFVNRYISVFMKRHMPDREFFLQQLEDVARENNVILPTTEDLEKLRGRPKRKDKMIAEVVDLTRPNKVSEYKYYYDGSNYVAYVAGENKVAEREVRPRTQWDDLFDVVYPGIKSQYSEKNKSFEEKLVIRQKVESELISQFYTVYDYDDSKASETCPEFVARKLYNMSAAYMAKKRRFTRKKDQVRWTAWWTITFSDEKFASGAQFRRRLLKKFNNLCVRKGWRIMGVFENGGEYGRLHFHGFFYIPEGQEVGSIEDREHWSEKAHCRHKYKTNTEFERDFGINEYEDIGEALRSDMNAMAMYTTKMCSYMEKGGIVYYSRHIPTEFLGVFNSHDMLIAFNVTCKRKIKRYVIDPHVITRSDMNISRTEKIYSPDDPRELGLLDLTV